MSGRIAYRKVVGEKNPADLMTKHMTAELASRHLGTMNMKLTTGRSSAAPTLDSLVQAWYSSDGDVEVPSKVIQKVRFSDKVHFRAITASGRCKRTPERGRASSKFQSHHDLSDVVTFGHTEFNDLRDLQNIGIGGGVNIEEEFMNDGDTKDHQGDPACGCRRPREFGRGSRAWSELDDDPVCIKCAKNWQHLPNSTDVSIDSLGSEPAGRRGKPVFFSNRLVGRVRLLGLCSACRRIGTV